MTGQVAHAADVDGETRPAVLVRWIGRHDRIDDRIVPLHGAIAGMAFGRENFGRVMGLMRPAMMPLQVSGLPFAGWVFDTRGDYTLAFQVFLGLYVAAALCTWALRLPDRDDPARVRSVAETEEAARPAPQDSRGEGRHE